MKKIRFLAFKISETLDLELLSSFFKLTRTIKWKDFLKLDNEMIETVLNRGVTDHKVYLYAYGCIAFVDFYEDEIRLFLKFIETIVPVDEHYFYQYVAHYEAYIGDYGEGYLFKSDLTSQMPFKQIEQVIAEAVSKSVALEAMESQMEDLMERIEPLILQMDRGRIKVSRKTLKILGHIISFKYNMAQNIDIYHKDEMVKEHLVIDDTHQTIYQYFELYTRYQRLMKKNQDLRKIVLRYYEFNAARKERQLYLFEVFLLVLFPLTTMLGLPIVRDTLLKIWHILV